MQRAAVVFWRAVLVPVVCSALTFRCLGIGVSVDNQVTVGESMVLYAFAKSLTRFVGAAFSCFCSMRQDQTRSTHPWVMLVMPEPSSVRDHRCSSLPAWMPIFVAGHICTLQPSPSSSERVPLGAGTRARRPWVGMTPIEGLVV